MISVPVGMHTGSVRFDGETVGTLEAMSGDERGGPPPFDDRDWRHPSELPPDPPRHSGRTFTGIAGLVGALAAVALVTLVLPTEPKPTTTPVTADTQSRAQPPADVREAALVYDSASGEPLAVLSRTGFLVGALEGVSTGDRVVFVDRYGRPGSARVVAIDDALVWLHTVDPDTDEFVDLDESLAVSPPSRDVRATGDRLWIVGARNRIASATVGVTGPGTRDGHVSLDPRSVIDAQGDEPDDIGAAVDDAGRLLGICVRQRDVRLVVPLERLMVDLARLESGGRGR